MPEGDGGSRVDAASVDDAIAQVLQAERDARDNVRHCAREAEGIVERAHETARQIARRAAHRSVRVQLWSASALQRQLAGLAQLAAQGNAIAAHADSPGALQRAVEELAAQLTGALR